MLVAFASCSRNPEKLLSPNIVVAQANATDFLSLAKGKPMFLQLNQYLDVTRIEQVTGAENVIIYMAKFKDDPNKIYAVNTIGSELLYAGKMQDEKNGTIGVAKNGEAIAIEIKNGVQSIKDINSNEFTSRFAKAYHGGIGFCQREAGETFSECFAAESNEFCDSFVSCVALATQPSVAIIIGLACSCNASKQL